MDEFTGQPHEHTRRAYARLVSQGGSVEAHQPDETEAVVQEFVEAHDAL